MSIAQKRGGQGPRFNDDLVNAALIFAGVLLVVFFLLVARLYLDAREGRKATLRPERSPAKVLGSMFDQRGE